MAPVPYAIGRTLGLIKPIVLKRNINNTSQIAAIIIASLVSALMLASAIYTLHRVWRSIVYPRLSALLQARCQVPTSGRQNSSTNHWARKDSNVLWSMFINDEDLIAQFPCPPRDSRLFSIGSFSTVDTVCPLDIRKVDEKGVRNESIVEETGPRNESNPNGPVRRPPYEREITPTPLLPWKSSRRGHSRNVSAEKPAARRSSLPVHSTQITDKKTRQPSFFRQKLGFSNLGRHGSVAAAAA